MTQKETRHDGVTRHDSRTPTPVPPEAARRAPRRALRLTRKKTPRGTLRDANEIDGREIGLETGDEERLSTAAGDERGWGGGRLWRVGGEVRPMNKFTSPYRQARLSPGYHREEIAEKMSAFQVSALRSKSTCSVGT